MKFEIGDRVICKAGTDTYTSCATHIAKNHGLELELHKTGFVADSWMDCSPIASDLTGVVVLANIDSLVAVRLDDVTGDQKVVVVEENDIEKIEEPVQPESEDDTEYLMSSSKNAERLLESVAQVTEEDTTLYVRIMDEIKDDHLVTYFIIQWGGKLLQNRTLVRRDELARWLKSTQKWTEASKIVMDMEAYDEQSKV
ncbi:YoeB-like TA antitoxin [Pseudomonas phage EM]|uniref:YoeB-like TA antitoxin n=1 Tax=Pseudomonas phage EM TaxID=2936914 RepID=A0AAE9HJ14_9CAUD|nr:YoeB-like TA antitoxin [Pseudomonas phage EM]UPW35909.1 YoeB-like TA antitoxin [Pseudomonas phage EM]